MTASSLLFAGLLFATPTGPATDLYGDPLPSGAVARLGTARLRHGSHGHALVFSADGRWLYASAGPEVCVWDTATGKLHATLAGECGGQVLHLTLSPDGKYLAAAATTVVYVWDLNSSKPPRLLRGHCGRVWVVAFAPDSRTLATVAADKVVFDPATDNLQVEEDRTVRLWDVATGKEVGALANHPEKLWGVAFLDDKHLATCGRRTGIVRIWSLASAGEVRQLHAEGTDVFGLQPDRAGKTLWALVAHEKTTVIQAWDLTSGKLLPRAADLPRPAHAYALSPDGKRLAVIGSAGVDLCDAMTGKVQTRLVCRGNALSTGVAFSPDGKRLAAVSGPRVCVWDVATGKELFDPAGHAASIRFVRFLPDAKTVLAIGHEGKVCLWDAATGKLLRAFSLSSFAAGRCDLSPDGKTLVVYGSMDDDGFWDVTTGAKKAPLPDVGGWTANAVALARDGKTMAATGGIHIIATTANSAKNLSHFFLCLFDAVTGKQLHQFGDNFGMGCRVVYSPDGSRLVATDGDLHIWDVTTRTKLAQVKNCPGDALFVTPDGASVGVGTPGMWGVGTLALVHWPSAAWRAVPVDPSTSFAALSPDGKMAVFTPTDGSAWVQLRDLRSGKRLAQLVGHRGPVEHAAFSPDGKYLVTGGSDGTLLIWEVTKLLGAKRKPVLLQASEAEALWADLGSQDQTRRVAAIDRLAEAPEAALALVKKHVQPLLTTEMERWLADLDSINFATRDRAMRELGRLEFAAEPALRQVLAGKPSLEMRLRVEKLLKDLAEPSKSPRWQAMWHAVIVLEPINTPGARDWLEALAKGAPEGHLTRAAQAALQRLALP